VAATIESVQIKNFQSHANTEIEFASAGQLTAIIGPSDNGKTAVFRAIRWAVYNEPRGTDFIRVGTNQARVTIALAEGNQVIRERSRKGFNRYIFRDAGNKEQVFEGFGDTVPLEIQEALGIRPVIVGDLKLNLNMAEQLEGPFLGKHVSAPAKAKILGKLAGTEEVDIAGKQLNTDLYRRRQDEKSLSTEIAGLREELKKYDYLPELERVIAQVSIILTVIKENRQKKDRLEELQENLQKADQQIKTCIAIIDNLEMFILATELPAGMIEISIIQRNRLITEKRKLDEITAGINAAQDVLVKTAGIIEAEPLATSVDNWLRKFTYLYPPITSLKKNILPGLKLCDEKIDRLAFAVKTKSILKNLEERCLNYEFLNQKVSQVRICSLDTANTAIIINSKNFTIQTLQDEYQDILVSAGVCPLCGAEVSQFKLKEVI